ncbi:MAG: aminotransferase class I/II-fold pyridoxal phosphate-dependent enzyme [Candidatus Parcubacteria bacterium]|nr:aminotransferase class I/II-fold pyridoxal phosphate-dependent enzyme [Candidatus Parcubacteria bacterium]
MDNNGSFYQQAQRLQDAAYDVRNPKIREARLIIEQTIKEELRTKPREEIKQLHSWNIGNPPYFGIQPPEEINHLLQQIQIQYGYSPAQGLEQAIESIFAYHQSQKFINLKRENIFGTDGVSEGIRLVTTATLNPGDEILLPTPNYPLWRLFVQQAGAIPVHYQCDEKSCWYPDLADIIRKISGRTKAILLINPNNPTGAIYSLEILQQIISIAREHRLIIFADEVYNEVLYGQAKHIPIASISDEVLIFTLNGLSKNRLMPGIRSGWIAISGPTHQARDLINGINLLVNARLCPNIYGQLAIPLILPRADYLRPLLVPGGRFFDQIEAASQAINQCEELSCVKADATMYLYVKINSPNHIANDEKFILDLLNAERVQLVQGTGFDDKNLPRHIRIVCLAPVAELTEGIGRIIRFLQNYKN